LIELTFPIRIDNPLLHLKPGEADERARQFARQYGFGHLQELFVKVATVTHVLMPRRAAYHL
jgi:hypothetical protein